MEHDWSVDTPSQWDADDDDMPEVVTRSIEFAARALQDHLQAAEAAASHLDDVVAELGTSERASHHIAVTTGLALKTVMRMMNGERLLHILRPLGTSPSPVDSPGDAAEAAPSPVTERNPVVEGSDAPAAL